MPRLRDIESVFKRAIASGRVAISTANLIGPMPPYGYPVGGLFIATCRTGHGL
jgi:hypothetical protein